MDIFCEILIAFLICTVFVVLIKAAQDWLILPVKPASDTDIKSVITVKGDCEGLEYVLRGLAYLRECGKMSTEIEIVPGEMTPDGAMMLDKIAEEYPYVHIIGE